MKNGGSDQKLARSVNHERGDNPACSFIRRRRIDFNAIALLRARQSG